MFSPQSTRSLSHGADHLLQHITHNKMPSSSGPCNSRRLMETKTLCSSATQTEVFPCFFLSCKANARVKLAKMGHGTLSSKLVVMCVVLLLFLLFYVLFEFVLFYVLFVCKCVLYYCHWVLTRLQLTNISYHITKCQELLSQ